METFSQLLQQLYFTSSNNEKSRLLRHYLAQTADPDRGWAIAALAGTLKFEFLFKFPDGDSNNSTLVISHVT